VCGVASRRAVEDIIIDGRVKVNGKVITDLSTQIADGDVVELDKKKISPINDKIYIVMNKPRGCITTCSDERKRKTIMDKIPQDIRKKYPHIFPVGRLDYDTEGLIFLTNDGDFAQQITHPSNKIEKTYVARVSTPITDTHIKELKTHADRVKQIDENTLEIVIHEGKNRQVRKMLGVVGLDAENLKRISVGKYKIDKLRPGEIICLNKPPVV